MGAGGRDGAALRGRDSADKPMSVEAFRITPPIGAARQGWDGRDAAPSRVSNSTGLPDYLFRNERQNQAHADGGQAPFLNEAKAGFVCRRMAETCLGGWRFAAGDQGCLEMGYVHVIQFLLLAMPYSVAVLVEAVVDGTNGLAAAVVYASAIIILAFITRACSAWADKRADGMSVVMAGRGGFGTDEDEVDFEGCAHASTFTYICALPRSWKRWCVHIVMIGLVCFCAEACLEWDALGSLLVHGDPTAEPDTARAVAYIGGWIATCVTIYALAVHEPTDPNIHAVSCSGLSRGFHLCSTLLPLLLEREHTLKLPHPVTIALIALVATMPLWWLLGSLPPVDAAIGWVVEQCVVHLHGCSAAASPVRLAVAAAGAWVTVAITWGAAQSSTVQALAAASLLGALLSQDLLPMVRIVGSGDTGAVAMASADGLRVAMRLVLGGVPAAALLVLDSVYGTDKLFSSSMLQLGAQILLVLRILAGLMTELQRPFLLSVMSNCAYGKTPRVCGSLYGALMALLRVSLSVYVLFALRWEQHNAAGSSPSLLWCIAAARALRAAWQRPADVAVEAFVAAIIIDRNATLDVSYPVLLLLSGLAWSRIVEFKDKVVFLTSVLVTSWSSAGQRNSFKGWAHILITAAYPLWIAVAAAAAALSAPLLPVVGSPCFLIGFPRPRWHGGPTTQAWRSRTGSRSVVDVTESEGTADQALYKHMLPSLCEQFAAAYSGGATGELRAGDQFVGRYEDCVVWVSVLECGYGYHVLAVQGLELRITSCHNVEGLRMDDVLAPASVAKSDVRSSSCTSWPGHLLRPVCAMTVHAYSNSPTVLTGIIDSKENLERFPAAFLKALVWSFSQAGARLDGDPPVLLYGVGQKDKATAEVLFPRSFAEHVENKKLCPAVDSAQKYAGQRLGELVSTAFVLAEAHRPQRPSEIYGMFCSAASGKRASGCNDRGVPAAFREIIVRSYQMGFKLVYDAAIYMLSDLENVEEVAAVLEELENDWHIGAIEDPEWNRKMLAGTPKLFTVGTDSGSVVDQGEGGGGGSETFTARILQARAVETLLGRLNPEAVRGLWSSMGHELLYLTNDDDERFSIQANPALMRNLTMQAAPTPLGYPAFEACHVSVDSRGAVSLSSNVSPVEKLDVSATAAETTSSTAATATVSTAGSKNLPYNGDMQAAMRAQDRDAIRQIMAARSDRVASSAVASSNPERGNDRKQSTERTFSPSRSPTIHRPTDAAETRNAVDIDDLDELDMMLGDAGAATKPSSVVPRSAGGGGGASSWMDSILNEIDNDANRSSNPFVVPSTTPTNANSTRSATRVVLPSPEAFQSKFGAVDGGSDDELLAQLAASEDRLNAARASAAVGHEGAASMQRILGPRDGRPAPGGTDSGTIGDADLDELDDLLEEFL